MEVRMVFHGKIFPKAKYEPHRWAWRTRKWWTPLVQRNAMMSPGQKTATHIWWGPLHFWKTVGRFNEKCFGLGWR